MISKRIFLLKTLTVIKKMVMGSLVIVSSVFLTLSIAELGARAYLALFPNVQVESHIDFRKSIPLPYKDAPYNVVQFVEESFNSPGWITPENTRLVVPKDFDGTYIHIKDGLRRTAFQPDDYMNTIYVFGASTVFCNEVPDEYTVTSYLQKLVSEKFGNTYRVENYGATSVISSQELERLRTVALKKGDVVIFYDGANDVIQTIYNNDPAGWIIGTNKQVLREAGSIKKFLIKLHARWGEKSKFIYHFLSPYEYGFEPIHMRDKKLIQQLADQMYQNYLSNIKDAHGYTTARDATFFHFLQPTLFSGSKRTMYEWGIENNTHLVNAGIGKALRLGFPQLKAVVNILHHDRQINSYDISNVFDGRVGGDEVFLDWLHVSEKGNAYIARKMFEYVKDNL